MQGKKRESGKEVELRVPPVDIPDSTNHLNQTNSERWCSLEDISNSFVSKEGSDSETR